MSAEAKQPITAKEDFLLKTLRLELMVEAESGFSGPLIAAQLLALAAVVGRVRLRCEVKEAPHDTTNAVRGEANRGYHDWYRPSTRAGRPGEVEGACWP